MFNELYIRLQSEFIDNPIWPDKLIYFAQVSSNFSLNNRISALKYIEKVITGRQTLQDNYIDLCFFLFNQKFLIVQNNLI